MLVRDPIGLKSLISFWSLDNKPSYAIPEAWDKLCDALGWSEQKGKFYENPDGSIEERK
jgi:hypothetical protein